MTYKTTEYLNQRIRSNAVSHCYLLVTPVKSVAEHIFYDFARQLFCKNSGCGECSDCKRVVSGSHSGIHIYPDKLNTEAAEEIIEDLHIKPIDGEWKLYFIAAADGLIPAVQNKLLKSLEEPPEYAIFFLAAANEDGVLKTVVSRSEKLYETYIDPTIAEGVLRRESPGDDFARHASLVADGFLDKARELFYDEGFRKQFNECVNVFNQVKKSGDIVQVLNLPVFEKEHLKMTLHIMSVIVAATLKGLTQQNDSLLYIKDTSASALARYQYIIEQAQKKARFHVNSMSIAENMLMSMLEAKYLIM